MKTLPSELLLQPQHAFTISQPRRWDSSAVAYTVVRNLKIVICKQYKNQLSRKIIQNSQINHLHKGPTIYSNPGDELAFKGLFE